MSEAVAKAISETSPTVSECRTIPVDELHDNGLLDPEASGTLFWNQGDSTIGSLHWERADHAGGHDDVDRAVEISHAAGPPGRADRREATISITTTECNFGGERPWFLCPGCGERVGKLHRPPVGDRFRCRECHDLAYESSRVSGNPKKTARLRYERVHKKLEPDADNHHPNLNGTLLAKRPKGMHRDTYRELHDELTEAHDEWLVEVERDIARSAAKFERLYKRRGSDDAAEEREEWKEESKRRIKQRRVISLADEIVLQSWGVPIEDYLANK